MGRKICLIVEIHDDADERTEDDIKEVVELDGVVEVRDITPVIDVLTRSSQGAFADRANLKQVGEYAASFTGPGEGLIATTVLYMTINTICRMLGQPSDVVEESTA